MNIYDNWLGGYVYIKYATESPKTGDSNKLYTLLDYLPAPRAFVQIQAQYV